MNFQDASIIKLLDTYSELLGREALPLAKTTPETKFSLRIPKQLTQAEAIFMLEAIAALNNLKLELVGENQVQIVPAP